eukprot:9167048-Pyramimonas_sp.AAC.1
MTLGMTAVTPLGRLPSEPVGTTARRALARCSRRGARQDPPENSSLPGGSSNEPTGSPSGPRKTTAQVSSGGSWFKSGRDSQPLLANGVCFPSATASSVRPSPEGEPLFAPWHLLGAGASMPLRHA